MDLFPVPEPFRQISPRDARPVAIKHRLHEQTVVLRSHSDMTFTTWQQTFNPIPLIVPQPITTHPSAPSQLTAYESLNTPLGNPLFEDTP